MDAATGIRVEVIIKFKSVFISKSLYVISLTLMTLNLLVLISV